MWKNIPNFIRALRLAFASASILPFVFGSLLARPDFSGLNFVFGLIAVVSVHLGANLINDYADSKSGADWQDRRFYKFFGGSKLIQEKVFPEHLYRNLAIGFFILATFSVIILAVILESLVIFAFYFLILFLGWSYSVKPLQLSYKRLGEPVIFILFGPALVMGGYYIQTGIFPTLKGFMLSIPFGLLTAAILYANEIPDSADDEKAGKFTLVSIFGPRKAFVLYYALIMSAFFFIVLGIIFGYLSLLACLSFIFIFPALRAANILKEHFADKLKLMESSKLTIAVHMLVSVVLILAIL